MLTMAIAARIPPNMAYPSAPGSPKGAIPGAFGGITWGTTVMTTNALAVFPFSVAVTVSVTTPASYPAVKVVAEPPLGLTAPRVLFNDHAYAMPEDGQEPSEHTAAAVNP